MDLIFILFIIILVGISRMFAITLKPTPTINRVSLGVSARMFAITLKPTPTLAFWGIIKTKKPH